MAGMTQRMREGYAGTGPGATTPDGCAVELWAFPDVRWAHTFVSGRLTEEQFAQALAEAGLAVEAVLTPDRTWVRAVPVTEQ
jgi:hypothetical protein